MARSPINYGAPPPPPGTPFFTAEPPQVLPAKKTVPSACTFSTDVHTDMEGTSAMPSRMSRQLTGGNVQEGTLLGIATAPAAASSCGAESDSDEVKEEKAVNLCMIGTGEYTTGYVHGGASDSDKGAGGRHVALGEGESRRGFIRDRVIAIECLSCEQVRLRVPSFSGSTQVAVLPVFMYTCIFDHHLHSDGTVRAPSQPLVQ